MKLVGLGSTCDDYNNMVKNSHFRAKCTVMLQYLCVLYLEVSVALCELRWYSGNSRSKRECKAALFLTFACNNWGNS